jgi:hypothetical protein
VQFEVVVVELWWLKAGVWMFVFDKTSLVWNKLLTRDCRLTNLRHRSL